MYVKLDDDKKTQVKQLFTCYATIYQYQAQALAGFTIAGYVLIQIIVFNICTYYLPILRPDFSNGPVIMSMLSVLFFAILFKVIYLKQLDNKKNELVQKMSTQAASKNITAELYRYALQFKSKNKKHQELANSLLY